MNRLRVGSDFSGVGAFDQALMRLEIKHETVFACDMDKYVRQTYVHNYGEPNYYPENVYHREIPEYPLDVYMTSPPCQAFSLAGKRKGESDKRGILFYNSHEFIQKNRPRYFIFENVKGLLSDAGGLTFRRWIDLLGGKSVNGLPIIFPNYESVPYHIYWKVINAKDHGIPQNRERVFIIGIRDDDDNNFTWPKDEHLSKCLADVLETDVDQKYFLSAKAINFVTDEMRIDKKYTQIDGEIALCLTAKGQMNWTGSFVSDKSKDIIEVGKLNNSQDRRIHDVAGISQCLSSGHNNSPKILQRSRGNNSFEHNNHVIQISQSKESGGKQPYQQNRVYADYGIMTTLDTDSGRKSVMNNGSIRRLTPRECFRLMDYPDSFTWPVSDSQAYKQAGNSICVGVLAKIISKLNLYK